MAAGRLHGFPQSHQTDGTLVFTLQGWVELHVVSLRLLGEGAGRVGGGAAHAGALLLGGGAAGAGHGRAAAALPVPASTAAVTVQQAHGSWARPRRSALQRGKTMESLKVFQEHPSLPGKNKIYFRPEILEESCRLGSTQNHWVCFVLVTFFPYLVIWRKGCCILSAQFKPSPLL